MHIFVLLIVFGYFLGLKFHVTHCTNVLMACWTILSKRRENSWKQWKSKLD